MVNLLILLSYMYLSLSLKKGFPVQKNSCIVPLVWWLPKKLLNLLITYVEWNPLLMVWKLTEEAGRAQFNMATATYTTVAYSAVWFINKTHLKLLQEGFNVEPQWIFG